MRLREEREVLGKFTFTHFKTKKFSSVFIIPYFELVCGKPLFVKIIDIRT